MHIRLPACANVPTIDGEPTLSRRISSCMSLRQRMTPTPIRPSILSALDETIRYGNSTENIAWPGVAVNSTKGAGPARAQPARGSLYAQTSRCCLLSGRCHANPASTRVSQHSCSCFKRKNGTSPIANEPVLALSKSPTPARVPRPARLAATPGVAGPRAASTKRAGGIQWQQAKTIPL
jgi:hypothetical protein